MNFQESNPSTLAAGLRLALQYHPVAAIVVGVPYALWSSVVPASQQAGVKLLPLAVGPAPVTDTVLPQVNGTAYQEQQGGDLANWVIADSNGKRHVLVLMVPAYAALSSFLTSFKNTLDSRCPDCSITVLNATIPQIDGHQTNGLVVAGIHKDSKINYFVTSDSVFSNGPPQTLSGAGLAERVKIGGAAYGPEQVAAVKMEPRVPGPASRRSTAAGSPSTRFLRAAQGMHIVGNEPLPEQLITKQNVDTLKSTSYDVPPFDYASQFARTWRVG